MFDNQSCIYCNSLAIIKFGKTKNGIPRLKCKDCQKTWILNKELIDRPDDSELVSKYFDGYSTRQLIPFYQASPQKINKTIRNYLNEIPNWEVYIEDIVNQKEHEMVYLIGQNFSCNCEHDDCNNNYLAVAIDAVSSLVLSYEISISNTSDVWEKLIKKMSYKKIKVKNFVSKIDDIIDYSLKSHYPESKRYTNLLKASRQKEISICLKKEPIRSRLVSDAIKTFYEYDNKTLESIITNFDNSFEGYLNSFSENFINEIEKRCEVTTTSNDSLLEDFKERFEKFHMIKCEPEPLINGWISYNMIKKLDCGFNRLEYYLKEKVNIDFEKYSKNERINKIIFNENSLKKFIFEVGARFVNLPNINTKCDKRNTINI